MRPVINVLTFTLLYPNPAEPNFGIFVENRIRRLVETRQVALSVVAPVPWFPLTWKRFGRYAAYARVPRHEIRHGIEGNLCRCTGYHNIVKAIEYAGAKMRGEEPAPAEWEVTA